MGDVRTRVLLVHPLGYAEGSRAGSDISRIASLTPPLGMAGIASYLEREGVGVEIVDCYAQPRNSEAVIRDILVTKRPEVIGFSCVTSNFLDAVRLAGMAKALVPGIKTIVGGAHASALREKVLEGFPEMDFVAVGEGERTLLELVEGREPAEVKGLVRRAEGGAVFNGYREDALVLDELPYPAYEKLAGFPHVYKLPIFNYPKAPNASCNTSRGCPYACSYCDRSVFRRSFRFNSAEYMYEHLKYLRDRFKVRHINFYDDQFTFNRKRIDAFTTMMSDRPLGLTFKCAVRAEHVDEELLRQMKAAGCWMVSLGIETGDPELLARHRQNPDLDMLAGKVRMMQRSGLRVKGLLMIGLPGESEASIRRSMAYVKGLRLDMFNLAKFTPFPGSPVYENIREQGEFEEDWPRMNCLEFLFIPKGMTREKLDELFIEFHKEYFKQPHILADYVKMAWRSPDSYRRFFLNLGDFIRFAVKGKKGSS